MTIFGYSAKPWLLAALMCSLTAVEVYAHTRWDLNGLVKPRTTRDDIKTGPCGATRTTTPVVLQAGATVTVQFESTIFHNGYFRIAFSPSGDQGFEQNIIANNIPDYAGQRFRTFNITLPNIECDQCTLQLIQVMLDRTPPTNYYSCADIKLVKPIATDTQAPGLINNLTAIPGDSQLVLNWTNPGDVDLAQVLVALQPQTFDFTPVNGTHYELGDHFAAVVSNRLTDNLILTELTPGATYFYKIFTADSSLNYSAAVSGSVKIPQKIVNIAPSIRLDTEQNQNRVTLINPQDGLVWVQATITDLNPTDQHHYDWSGSDQRLVNTSQAEQQLVFDPSRLAAGEYTVTLTVTDNGSPALSAEAMITLEVAAPPIEPPPAPPAKGGSLSLGLLLGLLIPAAMVRRCRANQTRQVN